VNGNSASAKSVRDGSWLVARPLFMYTNGKPAGVIAKFIDFMLSKEGQKIVNEVKYVSIK
jgi:phosphate transport system substrate-binding protein